MPTYTDPFVTAQWLYSKLNVSAVTTLATGGIYRNRAIANGTCPYVVMRMAFSRDDLRVVGTTKIWSPQMWDVVAVGTDLQAELVDRIAAAIDLLLDRIPVSGTPANGIVYECVRERPISFTEADEGIDYHYIGGQYLIKAKATS